MQIVDIKICIWCGSHIPTGILWDNHPYECNFFKAVLKEMRMPFKFDKDGNLVVVLGGEGK